MNQTAVGNRQQVIGLYAEVRAYVFSLPSLETPRPGMMAKVLF
jgi:hypothetical protein